MMRLGIKDYLSTQDNITIVGEVSSGSEVASKVRALSPDVVLMDINLPGLSGLEATILLQREFPIVKVIILTMYDDREYILKFVNSGASGYVLKKNPPSELLQAIESVYHGGAFFSPSVAQILLEEHQKPDRNLIETVELSYREKELLKLLAQGYNNKQIASKMFLSPRTVEKYRTTIMQKLELHSVAEMIRYAIVHHLTDLK